MEANENNKKLNKYELESQTIFTGFSTFEEAEEYANNEGGTVVEVGFKDGNDNPQITTEAGLVEKNCTIL